MIDNLKYTLNFWKDYEEYKIQSDGFHCINVPEGCKVDGFFPIESVGIDTFKSNYGNQKFTKAVDKLLSRYYERNGTKIPPEQPFRVSGSYNIYCDGSCAVHSSKSGRWAFAVIDDKEEVFYSDSGTVTDTTNGETEVLAFYEALKYVTEHLSDSEVNIYCDSSYVVKSYNEWCDGWRQRGWRKANGSPIKHMDTWIEIDKMRSEHITVQWIKGHSTSKWNNYVDELTRQY